MSLDHKASAIIMRNAFSCDANRNNLQFLPGFDSCKEGTFSHFDDATFNIAEYNGKFVIVSSITQDMLNQSVIDDIHSILHFISSSFGIPSAFTPIFFNHFVAFLPSLLPSLPLKCFQFAQPIHADGGGPMTIHEYSAYTPSF